ncbi:MAG: rhamnogalacturonan lyase [Prevotella sp.]|nr:rhamnogalacturonan lyase [Prevotella sp.]
MMRTILLSLGLLMPLTATWSQAKYDLSQLVTEKLDRGVVAVRHEGATIVSWRSLSTDRKGEPFDVYRDGVKLNATPLTTGGTMFVDSEPASTLDVTYEVRGGGVDGSFTLCGDAPVGYVSVKIDKPADGYTPDGRRYSYSANDASVGDVDGDGRYELILKWEPSNAHDNSQAGFTGPVLLDCYRLSGERLWRIDLGRNIRAGAHYTQFLVYDFDGDGRAELMVKTADGTRDGQGRIVGDSLADWREGAREAMARFEENKQKTADEEAEMQRMRKEWEQARNEGRRPDRRQMQSRGRRRGSGNPLEGRILSGPEYISVFNGLTGAVMDTKPYLPERGNVSDWGDGHANRSERYLAAVGYLGNRGRASGIFCRGYYTRTVIAAWDWDGHELTNRWTFDTNEPQWRDYAGQGNHNLRVADVDGDGLDEITYGSMAVDHDGTGLYNTGFGHGDAIHLIAEPRTNRLYIWDCHENKRDGSDLRDAKTGEVVFQIKSTTDVGRAMAADIDPTNPGMEMWSTDSHGIRTMTGEVLSQAKDPDDPQHDNTLVLNGRYLPVNYGIWWDGDLLRELLDHETVSKYNWQQKSIDVVTKFEGVTFNNGTKSNPCLAADILGDWREEVIVRDRESTELRIYVTPIATNHRIDCLMQDVPYRLSVATQNVGYNQPSEPGFYLGPDDESYLK